MPELRSDLRDERRDDALAGARILVVGRDADDARALADSVLPSGAASAAAARVTAGRDELAKHSHGVSAVVADGASLATEELTELLRACAEASPPLPCVVALHDPSVEDAVDLMRRGAFAVVGLPPRGSEIALRLEQAVRHHELCARNGELERSLEAHERLAMIGKLAAGVAHELNNPLDGVLRFVNLAADTLPKDSPQIPYLVEARRGLRRMADIVRDLLQFSRNANVEAADEDGLRLARDAVEAVVATAASAGRRRVETVYEFPPGGVHLPRAMFQVFGNLARNAVDAMPQGGVLRVAARFTETHVRIEVSDTGTGIPEEIRERVFEPFFTTKEVGSGTGLGLPICLRIVERLGGTLTVESEVGAGTLVAMDLPARRAPPRGRSAPAVRAGGVF